MKPTYRRMALVLAMALGLPLFAATAYAEDTSPRLAIREFTAKGIDADTAATLSEVACADFEKSGKFRALCPGDIMALLAATQQTALFGGCDDKACQEQLSRLLAAPLILTGSVGKTGKNYVITLLLMDVPQNKVLKRATQEVASVEKLLEGLHKAVADLLK